MGGLRLGVIDHTSALSPHDGRLRRVIETMDCGPALAPTYRWRLEMRQGNAWQALTRWVGSAWADWATAQSHAALAAASYPYQEVR